VVILVIKHVAERTLHDRSGKVIENKGDVFVSHGINIDTEKTVILPCELWSNFRHNCTQIDGEWYLK
jgi:hypothetical protein